jgi:hypothetical protein
MADIPRAIGGGWVPTLFENAVAVGLGAIVMISWGPIVFVTAAIVLAIVYIAMSLMVSRNRSDRAGRDAVTRYAHDQRELDDIIKQLERCAREHTFVAESSARDA